MEELWHDVRYALRLLRRSPGFSAIAICTLALGVGANTAIFSVINAVFLRPLPYPHPERIVEFQTMVQGQYNGSAFDGRGYFLLKDHLRSYAAFASYMGGGGVNLVMPGQSENLPTNRVTSEYFSALGVPPALGRAFTAQEDAQGGGDVVILSHALWLRRFNGDPSILSRTINLGGVPHQVVGVMPEALVTRPRVEVWLPLRPGAHDGGTNRGVVARLRDDAGWTQAQAELDGVATDLFRDRQARTGRAWRLQLAPYEGHAADDVRTPLFVLMASVALVLLIACANIANLLLARATTRLREIALRATLGAGRGRLVRQLLVESLVLSLIGGIGGLLIARWTLPALLALSPIDENYWGTIGLDRTVLLFTFTISLATGLLFGLVPALQVTRLDLSQSAREGGRASASRAAGLFRQSLIILEVATSVMLLVGALLLARTFMNLMAVPPGFDTRQVLTAQISLAGSQYDTTEKVARLYRQTIERLRRLPGVESVAIINNAPMERGLNTPGIMLGPAAADAEIHAFDWRYITPDYFTLLRTPILQGRAFSERDTTGAPRVAIVNQTFARRYFPGADPIGQRVSMSVSATVSASASARQPSAADSVEIVGIVPDLKQRSLREPAPPTMYVPVEQVTSGFALMHTWFPTSWLLRTREDAGGGLVAAVQREVGQIDPTLPFIAFRSMDERIASSAAQQRFHMYLIGACALLAVVLAGAGLFGVISYSVAQRTQEMGIRLALGATARQLVGSIVGQGAVMAGAGLVIGLAGAFAATRVLKSFLFGVSTTDPLTFAAAAVLLALVALAASLVPAWRVTRLDPALTLRAIR